MGDHVKGALTRARERARQAVQSGALSLLSLTTRDDDSLDSPNTADRETVRNTSAQENDLKTPQRLNDITVTYTPAPGKPAQVSTQNLHKAKFPTKMLPSAIYPNLSALGMTASGEWDSRFDFNSAYQSDTAYQAATSRVLEPRTLFQGRIETQEQLATNVPVTIPPPPQAQVQTETNHIADLEAERIL